MGFYGPITADEARILSGESHRYPSDETPDVWIAVDGIELHAKNYNFVSDALNLGDPFSCTVPAPDGVIKKVGGRKISVGDIQPGASVSMYISDPGKGGGRAIKQLTGIVAARNVVVDNQQGTLLRIDCADLGWHYQRSTGPVWASLNGLTLDKLARALTHDSWGVEGFHYTNARNIKLRLGRQAAQLAAQPNAYPATLPKLQVEPGQMCADILIQYCRLNQVLVGMSADGYLTFWKPDFKQTASYAFNLFPYSSSERSKNNVISAQLFDSIEGIYTDTACYSFNLMPSAAYLSNNPNSGHFRGTATSNALPFSRFLSFSDPQALNRDQANAHANWKMQRGLFDSWRFEIEVYGHHFRTDKKEYLPYVPGTMAAVRDEITGIHGNFFVQAVTWERTPNNGTRSRLVLRKPVLPAGS